MTKEFLKIIDKLQQNNLTKEKKDDVIDAEVE